MVNLSEIEAQAMELSVSDRATLASRLLHSLPPAFEDDDDGLAEALRRDAEMDADPSMCITLDELKRAVGR
jgi:putative addiction module component (TIGR02574 family)